MRLIKKIARRAYKFFLRDAKNGISISRFSHDDKVTLTFQNSSFTRPFELNKEM